MAKFLQIGPDIQRKTAVCLSPSLPSIALVTCLRCWVPFHCCQDRDFVLGARFGLCTIGTFWTLYWEHFLYFVLGAHFGLYWGHALDFVLGARFGLCTGDMFWTLHYRHIWDFVLGARFGLCTIGTVWTLYWGAHFGLCTGGTQGVGIAQLVQRPTEKQYRRGLESLVRHGVFLPESAASADYAHGVSTSPVYNRMHRQLCAR